jgi:hypothetical protein
MPTRRGNDVSAVASIVQARAYGRPISYWGSVLRVGEQDMAATAAGARFDGPAHGAILTFQFGEAVVAVVARVNVENQ